MAEKSFPLENTAYTAADAQLWFATRQSGVYAGTQLGVTANGTMALTLGNGIVWLHYAEFAGCVYANTTDKALTVELADAQYKRIDRVCIRLEMLNNKCYAYIKKGTAAASPAAPALQRDAAAYEISVAQIAVASGATAISAGDITDERLNEDVCGLMRDGVTGIDTSVMEAQFNAVLAELEDNLQVVYDNVKKANIYEQPATLTVDGWSGAAAPYTQEVAAAGILASDMPFVDVNMNGLTTVDDMTAAQDAFGLILKATAGAGKITFVASGKPETTIKIKIKNVRQSSKWGAIRYAVQDGDGPTKYPVGSQLSVHHDEYGTIVFDVVAHDLHKKPDDPTAHTMTLMMHHCIYGRQFDANELLWANTGDSALAAGAYNFTLYKGGNGGQTGEDGTYQFTTTKPIPAGGGWTHSAVGTKHANYNPGNITSGTVTTYDADGTVLESGLAVTVGSGGTALGTASNAKADCVNTIGTFNSVMRRAYGSNNWAESAARQWLNSSAAANSWWQRQTIFNFVPNYANKAGFLAGLDPDFVDALGAVDITTARNTIYEMGDTLGGGYTTRDKLFLPSMTEIGLGSNDSVAEGSALPLYDGATQTDRIKYDQAAQTTARYWWLRSPYPWSASSVRVVSPSEALELSGATYGYGVTAACVIY